jgi:prevent-host-death family protein
MAAFNVHEAKTHFSQLLDRVLEGEKIVITRNGVPVAELVAARQRGLVLGAGAQDPRYNPDAPDYWWQPMTDAEVEEFLEGRF